MRLNLYGVLDVKAQAYRFLHFVQSNGEAIRSFSDAVRNPKSEISKHPEDYSLYFLGCIDDETGVIESVNPVQFLSRGSEFSQQLNGSEVASA